MTKRLEERTVEEIHASGIARLNGEAPRIVPLKYPTLYKRIQEGRLRVYGQPMCVDVAHLLAQHRAGYPVLSEPDAAWGKEIALEASKAPRA